MIASVTRQELEKLVLAELRPAYRLAYGILRNATEAEDAAQEASLRAIRAVAQFRGGSFRPWFLTIVRNTCYNMLRSRRRAHNVISLDEAFAPRDADDYAVEVPSEAATPEQALLTASDSVLIRNLLDAMPPALREVLVLREIEEMSYQQIADIITSPIGTVMSRLSRARTELRKRYKKSQGLEGKNAL